MWLDEECELRNSFFFPSCFINHSESTDNICIANEN